MSQVCWSPEAGRRTADSWEDSLVCSATSRVHSLQSRNSRRPRRFVPWLLVSMADRDLFSQDRQVFSGGGCAPASP
jgi:hypothetical protein